MRAIFSKHMWNMKLKHLLPTSPKCTKLWKRLYLATATALSWSKYLSQFSRFDEENRRHLSKWQWNVEHTFAATQNGWRKWVCKWVEYILVYVSNKSVSHMTLGIMGAFYNESSTHASKYFVNFLRFMSVNYSKLNKVLCTL